MRTLKQGDTFKTWFEKYNEVIATGVVGSFSNDPDFNTGLDFFIRASYLRRGTALVNIPDTFVTLADNSVNVVYLDVTLGAEALASAVEGFTPSSDAIALYRVTTAAGVITLIEDYRTWLNTEVMDHQNLINRDDPNAHPQIEQNSIMYAIVMAIALGG